MARKVTEEEEALFKRGVDDGFKGYPNANLLTHWYYRHGVDAGKQRYRRFLVGPTHYELGTVVPPEPLPAPPPDRRRQYDPEMDLPSLKEITERAKRDSSTFSPLQQMLRLIEA